MKAIMISIKPEFVEKILNGEKTIEIRKTMSKCKLPCKVYIYCTKGKYEQYTPPLSDTNYEHAFGYVMNGKVVAEFTLKQVEKINCCAVPYMKSNNLGYGHFIDDGVYQLKDKDGIVFERNDNSIETMLKNKDFEKMKLSPLDVYKYISGYGVFYAWHIDELKIYDKPKELSEFRKDLDCDDYPCNKNRDCKYNYYDTSDGCWACGIDFDGTNCIYKQIKRPPQSWCYVEELENE